MSEPATIPAEPLLRVEGLSKRFGPVVALDGVSFSVRRGEVVGLLGDNGAGKSTLLKVMSGAHQPTSGTILVHGAPVEDPETVASAIRIGNPARWEDAMNAFTASRGEVRAVSDAEILDAYSLLGAREGVFCEPASAASVAGLLRNGAEGRVVCVLTGHGLKDPQTAMNRAASVVPCEPDIESVERAVLG